MTRPHPVVGITTELTDRARRSTYQTNVGIHLINEQEVLVAIIKRLHIRSQIRIAIDSLFFNLLGILGDEFVSLFFGHLSLVTLQYLIGYIGHVFQERNRQARIRQFFCSGHCPETVSQIVVFYRTVRLDLTETAMVVGNQQAFRRNQFTCTATTETYYCVFQR